MIDELQKTDTLCIEISHFTPNSPNTKLYHASTRDNLSERDELNSNMMKISIERNNRKANLTTIVNVNSEECLIGEKGGGKEKIQIKIENSNQGNGSGNKKSKNPKNLKPAERAGHHISKSQTLRIATSESKKLQDDLNSYRKDVYGNRIKKGNSKKCKVTFIDQVPPESIIRKKGNLVNFVNIESYKIFNVDMSSQSHRSGCKKCMAKCIIY
jgi:hypothetical protein